MEKRILQLVNDSIRDQFYSKALECLVALRQGCVQEEEPDSFNKFLRSLRNLFEGKRRNDFWELVASSNITLVHEGECDASSVSQQESEEVRKCRVGYRSCQLGLLLLTCSVVSMPSHLSVLASTTSTATRSTSRHGG